MVYSDKAISSELVQFVVDDFIFNDGSEFKLRTLLNLTVTELEEMLNIFGYMRCISCYTFVEDVNICKDSLLCEKCLKIKQS
jgi:hypothetical protein